MQHSKRGGLTVTVSILLASIGCSSGNPTASAEMEVPEVTPVTAGECFGHGIRCETPAILPFEPGEVRSCAEVDGGELRALWTAEVSEVDCFAGRCSVALNRVAVAPDGSVWASAWLFAPGSAGSELAGASLPIADALLVFDSKGTQTATITELRTRLRHSRPMPAPQVAFDELGRLTRLATARGADGLEATTYDRTGTRIQASRLVQGASRATGFAATAQRIVIGYGGEALEPGSDPPRLIGRSGLALFDSSLNAIWNQSALPPGHIRTRALTLPDAAGGLSLLMEGPQPPGRDVPHRLIHVDASGTLEWVRDLAGSIPQGVSVADGGAVVLVQTPDFARLLHRVAPDGRGLWQHQLEGDPLLGEEFLLGADAQGRVLLGKYEPTSIRRVSEDGRSCTSYRLPVDSCVTSEEGKSCSGVEIAFGPAGALAFITSNRVGVAQLEDSP